MSGSRRIVALFLLSCLACAALMMAPSDPTRGQDSAPTGAAALKKAVETGNALFRNDAFGTARRSCAKCHENPRKPAMNLKKRVGNYPKWDKRENKVITLGQKLNQMLTKMLKGKPEPLGSDRLVAVEAYLMSLSRQAD
jgi:cytochrome c